jgi:hypothetical protein
MLRNLLIIAFSVFLIEIGFCNAQSLSQLQSECTKKEKLDFLRKGYTAAEIDQICQEIFPSGGGTQCCCKKERVRYKYDPIIAYQWIAANTCLAGENSATITHQCVDQSFCAR